MSVEYKRILLIDDDLDDADIFREALAEADNSVSLVYADNCKRAVEMLKDATELPQLIFLDVNMPSVSGWECLRKLKAMDAAMDIPVVMFSTSSYLRENEKAISNGAAAFLTKPNSYNDLRKILQELISRSWSKQ